eukprot:365468-Chlamydomonas_euryale.AAC.7
MQPFNADVDVSSLALEPLPFRCQKRAWAPALGAVATTASSVRLVLASSWLVRAPFPTTSALLCDVQVTDVLRSLCAQVALPQSWQAPPPVSCPSWRANLDPLGIPPKKCAITCDR